jgi:hypothetical protein
MIISKHKIRFQVLFPHIDMNDSKCTFGDDFVTSLTLGSKVLNIIRRREPIGLKSAYLYAMYDKENLSER